jgi:hypothetical protein
MTYALNTDIETLAARLTSGLHGALEKAIRDKLMEQAEPIVSALARDMARSLHGSVVMYQDHMRDQVQVQLVLDGVKELVPKREL